MIKGDFMSSATLCFPSKEKIVSSLEQYLLTIKIDSHLLKETNLELTRKKVIETLANFFADQKKSPEDVYPGVRQKMASLELGLPAIQSIQMDMKLGAGLKGCATVHDIPIKKCDNVGLSLVEQGDAVEPAPSRRQMTGFLAITNLIPGSGVQSWDELGRSWEEWDQRGRRF